MDSSRVQDFLFENASYGKGYTCSVVYIVLIIVTVAVIGYYIVKRMKEKKLDNKNP